MFIELKEVTR